jgi:DNA-binding beta-propeller fold protein YncE
MNKGRAKKARVVYALGMFENRNSFMKTTKSCLSRLLVIILLCLPGSPAWADIFALQRQSPEIFRYKESNHAPAGTSFSPDNSESFDGLAFGPDGNVYVVDNVLGDGRVLRFNGQTGAFIDRFVDYQPSRALYSPRGVAFGPDGQLYVGSATTNYQGCQVMRFNGQTGAFADTFVPAGSGGLGDISDMTFGPDGRLYVLCSAQGILCYSGLDGHFISLFGSFPTNVYPRNLAFGPSGDLFVSTSANSVLRFNGTSGGSQGAFIAPGSGGLTNAAGLAFGNDGSLYASSPASRSVLHFDGTTGAFLDAFQLPATSAYSIGPTFLAITPGLPRLKIQKSGSGMVLSWRSPGTNFVLQSSESFSAAKTWSTVTNVPVLASGEHVVTVHDASSACLYRLKR